MKLIICILALVTTSRADTKLEDILTSSNDQFTAQMFYEVAKADPTNSIVISAFSVMPPLGQLALASTGKSHDELLTSLRLKNDNETKDVFSDVLKKLEDSENLKLANRVYVRKDGKINTQFVTLSREVFNSDVKNINFNESQKAAFEINSWVEKNTNNRIKDLVKPDSLGADTSCVLVNAIYFKGKWQETFKLNGEMEFHVTKEKSVKLPKMTLDTDLPYAKNSDLDAQLVQIGYQGGDSSLLIILPRKVDGITTLIEKLKDPSVLKNAIKGMSTIKVNVVLPKFKIETTTDLKDILKKMNVNSIFSPKEAHLDKLLEEEDAKLFVSDATQKAFIDVNEEGVEAAAANHFDIVFLMLPIANKIKFTADHPFLFYLMERDITLFSGVFRA